MDELDFNIIEDPIELTQWPAYSVAPPAKNGGEKELVITGSDSSYNDDPFSSIGEVPLPSIQDGDSEEYRTITSRLHQLAVKNRLDTWNEIENNRLEVLKVKIKFRKQSKNM